MIVLDCEQGSEEWFEAHLGIPTGSCFDRLITPTGKPSSSLDGYLNELVAEILMHEHEVKYETFAMKRGTQLEANARAWFEFITDSEVQQVGFVLRDDRLVGCSPDGLLPRSGLEIKCPGAAKHVGFLRLNELPGEYRAQVQGNIWLCETDTWNFVSYHPSLPKLLIEVPRDQNYINVLAEQVTILLDKLSSVLPSLSIRA